MKYKTYNRWTVLQTGQYIRPTMSFTISALHYPVRKTVHPVCSNSCKLLHPRQKIYRGISVVFSWYSSSFILLFSLATRLASVYYRSDIFYCFLSTYILLDVSFFAIYFINCHRSFCESLSYTW